MMSELFTKYDERMVVTIKESLSAITFWLRSGPIYAHSQVLNESFVISSLPYENSFVY